MTTDYEMLFATTPDALGPPSAEITRFCERYLEPQSRVLDYGCGQGRDALFLARLGHDVVGVDTAAGGISALSAAAAREGLAVEGVVADITGYVPTGVFDLLLFDRVLHMLEEADRLSVLRRAVPALAEGGVMVIVDEPRHRGTYRACLDSAAEWVTLKDARGLLFLRRA